MTSGQTTAPWGTFAVPARIEHNAEFGDRAPDGSFGYSYNYIDYHFADEAGQVLQMARAYLDEPGTVHVARPMRDLESPPMQDILCYFHLRYAKIMALGGAGTYTQVEAALLAHVDARVEDYLAHSEETV